MSDGLTLYTRQGCHLCEAFLHEMAQFEAVLLHHLTVIDVDDDATICQRFGDKVPILFAHDAEICRYFFDAEKIKSCLKLQRDSLE